MIESNDHVVFFLPNKRLVQEVERLFRVSATFFNRRGSACAIYFLSYACWAC